MASISGNSFSQGPHQVAQTWSSVTGCAAVTRALSPASVRTAYSGTNSPTAIGRNASSESVLGLQAPSAPSRAEANTAVGRAGNQFARRLIAGARYERAQPTHRPATGPSSL